jgi:hypothetical protein
VPLLIVADGKRLTLIDYQVKQVSAWPIGSSPLAVLLDPDKDLSRIAKVLPSSDPRVVLVQARDPRRPEFGTITLSFAKVSNGPAACCCAVGRRWMRRRTGPRCSCPITASTSRGGQRLHVRRSAQAGVRRRNLTSIMVFLKDHVISLSAPVRVSPGRFLFPGASVLLHTRKR